jgi:hypothetical protein
MPDQERNIIIYRTADGRASVALNEKRDGSFDVVFLHKWAEK